jgi:hypothetical protein
MGPFAIEQNVAALATIGINMTTAALVAELAASGLWWKESRPCDLGCVWTPRKWNETLYNGVYTALSDVREEQATESRGYALMALLEGYNP